MQEVWVSGGRHGRVCWGGRGGTEHVVTMLKQRAVFMFAPTLLLRCCHWGVV